MDIQSEKLRLIQWLAGLNDPSTIRAFIDLKKAREADWWDTISKDERAEIEEGLAQADRGEVVPHSEVMEKYKKWL
jgi:predicted transcriptional regulator